MFEINWTEEKSSFAQLLAANDKWVFTDGKILSLHDRNIVFVSVENEAIEMEKTTVNNMQEMHTLLKSKTFVNARFSPETGFIIIRRPYEYMPKIPQIDNDELLKEATKYDTQIGEIESSDEKWKDKDRVSHDLIRFKIDNIELDEMLQVIGENEKTEIRSEKNTGKLLLMNKITKTPIKHPKVVIDIPMKLLLGLEGYRLLRGALIGEKSEITIINGALILVKNVCKTVIAGRVE